MCGLARSLLKVERFGLYAPPDFMQDAMADDDKKTDGQQGAGQTPQPDSAGDQFSLTDILSQHRQQLEGKLGPGALLPDVSKLPEASTNSAQGAVEASAAVEEPSPDPPAPVASEEAGADESDAPVEVADVSATERTAEATQSLAEIIEQQAAQLRAKLGEGNAVSGTGELSSEQPPVPDGTVATDPSPDADQVDPVDDAVVAATPAVVESPSTEPVGQDEGESAGTEDDEPSAAVVEAQLTLAQIIAEQRAKLRAKSGAESGAESDTESVARTESPKPRAVKDDRQTEQPASKPKVRENATPDAAGADKGAGKKSRRSAAGGGAAPVQGEAGTRSRRTFLMVLFLGMNTILIGVVAVVVLRFLPSATRTVAKTRTGDADVASAAAKARAVSPLPPMMGGAERTEAEAAFKFGKFRSVAGRYKKLMEQAALRPADAVARDLFATRYARCLVELGQGKQARPVLRSAFQSESPILRGYAHYLMAFVDFREAMYMSARRNGYAAIGVLGAMRDRHALIDHCEYLIARAMSAKVVSLGSERMDLSWRDMLCEDPMQGLSELALYRLLGNGVETLAAAKRSPSLTRRDPSTDGRSWVARWSGPPLEQLLRQIGAEGKLDIRWGSGDASMKQRGVTVVFPDGLSEQRLAELACGTAGLMARFTGSEIIVVNPHHTESTKVEKDILGREAISMWRRFIMQRSATDRAGNRIAVGRYALARTYESGGDVADALRGYRLVTVRHEISEVAPHALYRSGMLRLGLMDFDGARQDLLDCWTRYPNSGLFGPAYLKLGIVIRKEAAHDKDGRSALLADAIRVFRRLYDLDVSLDVKKEACLELARCLNALGDYEKAFAEATKYLGYINTADSAGMAQAYLILAKTSAAANKLDDSARAFYQVLGSNPSTEMRVDVLMRMIPVHIARGGYVRAVAALNLLGREELSREQHTRYLVILSESYRAMGLTDKAVSILQRQIELSSGKTRETLSAELARCHIVTGNYKAARKILSTLIRDVPLVQVELAEVSLKLGETAAAIAAARAIVDMRDCPEELRRRAGRILGQAYVRAGKYDLAVSALMDVAARGKGGKGDG